MASINTSKSSSPAGVQTRWFLALTLGLPLLIIFAKLVTLPGVSALAREISLNGISQEFASEIKYVLTIPIGALIVVFVRITLGLRLLGPFRPILIAVALQMTGIVTGLLFLAFTLLLITALRPVVLAQKLPYYARVAVLLSVVVVVAIGALLIGKWFNLIELLKIAHFPIVVLCLAAESFARTLSGEGTRPALWRAGITAITALVITQIAGAPGVSPFLTAYPELVIFEIGLIVIVAKYFGLRKFASINPMPPKLKKTNKARKSRKRKLRSQSRVKTT